MPPNDLLAAVPGPGLTHRAALGISYGAGLRDSKLCNLKVTDIVPEARLRHDDSDRMLIHVDNAKGGRDRKAMLSPAFWLLRDRWSESRPRTGSFPGKPKINPLPPRQLDRAVTSAKHVAGIAKCDAATALRPICSRPTPAGRKGRRTRGGLLKCGLSTTRGTPVSPPRRSANGLENDTGGSATRLHSRHGTASSQSSAASSSRGPSTRAAPASGHRRAAAQIENPSGSGPRKRKTPPGCGGVVSCRAPVRWAEPVVRPDGRHA